MPDGRGQGLEERRVRSDPGKTMPMLARRTRLRQIHRNKFIALGPLDQVGQRQGHRLEHHPGYEDSKCNYTVQVEGVSEGMPSLEEDIHVCDSVMRMAPETNGEVAAQVVERAVEEDRHRPPPPVRLAEGTRGQDHLPRHPRSRARSSPRPPGRASKSRPCPTPPATPTSTNIPFRTTDRPRSTSTRTTSGSSTSARLLRLRRRSTCRVPRRRCPTASQGPHLTLSWITPHRSGASTPATRTTCAC